MTYAKDNGVWKIKTLDYHSGFGAPYTTGWVPPEPRPEGAAGGRGPRNLPHPADRPRNMPCEGFPAACIAPFHYANPGTSKGATCGPPWTCRKRRAGVPTSAIVPPISRSARSV